VGGGRGHRPEGHGMYKIPPGLNLSPVLIRELLRVDVTYSKVDTTLGNKKSSLLNYDR
jgi:hypothetical protein